MALERQRPGHRAQPGALALVGGGAGKGVAGRAHGRDEDLGARAVGQCQRGAGVVDEQLLAGALDALEAALSQCLCGCDAVQSQGLGRLAAAR